jgi:hypothetical protein
MEKTTKEKSKKIKVGDIPFEKIVSGFLEVKPEDRKKQNKNKEIKKKG